MPDNSKALTKPVDILKTMLRADSVQDQFKNALAENRGPFVASLIDIYANDTNLQQCDPAKVILEALKAATLKLPLNKSLGFAWIVPYKGVPQMQIGWKGFVQLAMRTGQYRHLNADVVYEGELGKADKLTGEIDLTGERKTDKIVGYFAYMETLNGFRKTVYWPAEKVLAHAKRYSKSFAYKDSTWQTNFEAMALKTVVLSLLRKYGILSVEMVRAIDANEDADEEGFAIEVKQNQAGEVIDISPQAKSLEAGDASAPDKEANPGADSSKNPDNTDAAEQPKKRDAGF